MAREYGRWHLAHCCLVRTPCLTWHVRLIRMRAVVLDDVDLLLTGGYERDGA